MSRLPESPALPQASRDPRETLSNLTRRLYAILAEISNSVNFLYVTLSDIGVKAPSYTVATVPDAASYEGYVIYVSDETGGATLAFSDGTDWRRVQDRAIIA